MLDGSEALDLLLDACTHAMHSPLPPRGGELMRVHTVNSGLKPTDDSASFQTRRGKLRIRKSAIEGTSG